MFWTEDPLCSEHGRIEEQLFLVLPPLVVLADLRLTRSLWLLLAIGVVGAALAVLMAGLYHAGADLIRLWKAWLVAPAGVMVLMVVVLIGATVTPAVALSGVDHSHSSNSPLDTGPPVRILLVGDSTALTLGLGLGVSSIDQSYDAVEMDEGILGCGVAEGSLVRITGQAYTTAAACNPSTPADQQWPAEWQGWIDSLHPNVVAFLAGRWEVPDRTYNGQWTNILNPTYQAYIKAQLQEAVNVATSQGARMVMLTAPCYDSGEQPNGAPWPEDAPERVDTYNDLLREVAAANASKVTVEDLYSLVCPGGQFETDIDGVPVRADDGVHFTVAGGEYLAPYLLPGMVAAGREQMGQAG